MSLWAIFSGYLIDQITWAARPIVSLLSIRTLVRWWNTWWSSGRWQWILGGMSQCHRGLNGQVRDTFEVGVQPRDLSKLVDLTIEVDNHQREQRRERVAPWSSRSPSSVSSLHSVAFSVLGSASSQQGVHASILVDSHREM